ncbi:hypothetical protein GOP47_0005900 [Adiantum capillus-veneris]|uniref:Uncharacterized protein n=1 Tax=Adiantum capillus-veneris TaxID=13818 RepID=A0A9D4V285_ADICA|nr:hypothetical protein GOP47_0005900 [Adiantum capillus-veneris]
MATAAGACSLRHPVAPLFARRESSFYYRHQHKSRGLPTLKRRIRASASDEAEDGDLQAKVQQADWRAFRARLLQKTASLDAAAAAVSAESGTPELWAHSITQPEPGCLLIANPTAFLSRQQYFHQAVIFLFAHSNEGSAGLILNRPTEYNLGQLAGFEELLPDFASCPLYMGGDVGANALHVVHGVHGLEDSMQVIPGVYMGGIKSMKASVQRGESKPDDYRWFVRYAGWGPGQLEREIAMGVWSFCLFISKLWC